jgi:Domain of unknown function (DUF5753)
VPYCRWSAPAWRPGLRVEGCQASPSRSPSSEAQATRVGEFQVAVVPGLLQTADYARELMSVTSGLSAWGQDAGAVDGQLRGQEILHDQSKQIQIVLAEGALRTLVVAPATLIGQLEKLLSVGRLPAVELGVIGFSQRMPTYPLGFRVYGDDLIITESIAEERYYTADDEPDEVTAFLEAFGELRRAASTGPEAEAIIQRVLEDLR